MRPGALRRAVAAAFALALPGCGLAGCSLGPDYHEPSPWSPASWFASRKPPTDPRESLPVPQPVDPNWWAAFDDPVLTSLEEQVASENLDVRVATIRLAESREQRRITSADQYANVNGSATYDRTRLSPRGEFGLIGGSGSGGGSSVGTGASSSGSNGSSSSTVGFPVGEEQSLSSSIRTPFNLWQYGFDASYELDLWGRVRRSIEAADASVDASAEDRRNTLVSVLAEVARDYVQLRDAQAQLQIARDNIKTDQDALTLTQQRFQGGLTTELDVANAAAQLSSVQATVPQQEQQVAQSINQLSYLLGKTPGALQSQLQAAKPVPPVPPHVPVGLPSELARRRPDIRMAEAQLHSATAQVGVSEADFYPQVTLSGNLTIQALRFKDLGNWDSRSYTFGPNVSLPIFQGGKLKAQLELSKGQQREAATNYQRTVLNAFHEVDNALIAYDAEQRRREGLLTEIDQDRRALALARDRYTQGLTSFLDVLNAERQLLSGQQQLETSTATVATNLVSLYKALGGGWETGMPVQQARADTGG